MVSIVAFRRLAFATALLAYLQISLGGVVRVTGSGLGCPDWPLCHGRPYPSADVHSIIEYSHRTVGALTGLLLVATVILAWVVFRQRRPVVAWLATASLLFYGVEGALGGVVVANELAPWLVLIHLGVAMAILGFLLATAVASLPATGGTDGGGLRRLAAVTAGATYLLVLTGSSVVASRADESCHSWPLCGGGFTPSFAGADAFTMLHRGAALVIGALIVYTAVRAIRSPALRVAGVAALVVLALQIAVGAGAAVTDGALFNGLHVAIATLVWASVLSMAVLSIPRADRESALGRLSIENTPA